MSVLCTIDELFGYCDDDWWQYFESNLATAVTSEIVQDDVRENYPDFLLNIQIISGINSRKH